MLKWTGLIILSVLLVGSASGATLTVDDSGGVDYTKIQDAINNASAGDMILVYSGTYYESVNVNKQLTLRGVDTGGGKPVVDAGGSNNGIRLYSNGIILEEFIITNSNYGVVLNSDNSNLIGNTFINNNVMGIALIASNNNNLLYNTVIDGHYGIALIGSSDNNLTGNTGSNNNNGIGIYLGDSSNNNTIRGNTISKFIEGIYLYNFSNNNTITDNTVSYNSMNGIYLYNSADNNLSRNNASYNTNKGIRLYSSTNNIFYNNYFNNTNNFEIWGPVYSNTWNTSKVLSANIIGGDYLGGNFWANPDGTGFSQTCTDANADGICDTNYALNAQNIDYLPLSLNLTTATNPLSSIGYSALVATGQNTFVQSSNGSFGLLLKGQSKTINNSVILNNTGDISAKVEARFNDSIGGVFGLVSGANVLNATNFALGLPSALAPLNNSGANVQVAVAPPGVTAMDARLGVPNEQAAGDYSGTVVLTFSNDV